jgi:hypothetical protein
MSDIVEEMRVFEDDHEPDGWPAIRMRQVSALCDEIEALRQRVADLEKQTEEINAAQIYLREQKRILTQLHEGAEREKELRRGIEAFYAGAAVDAKRYRWLKANWFRVATTTPDVMSEKVERITLLDWRQPPYGADNTLDNAIDAAMKGQE